jgi:hypothetical protein
MEGVNYEAKYLKYKTKYENLKNQQGGITRKQGYYLYVYPDPTKFAEIDKKKSEMIKKFTGTCGETMSVSDMNKMFASVGYRCAEGETKLQLLGSTREKIEAHVKELIKSEPTEADPEPKEKDIGPRVEFAADPLRTIYRYYAKTEENKQLQDGIKTLFDKYHLPLLKTVDIKPFKYDDTPTGTEENTKLIEQILSELQEYEEMKICTHASVIQINKITKNQTKKHYTLEIKEGEKKVKLLFIVKEYSLQIPIIFRF